MWAAFVAEMLLTMLLVVTVLGATDDRAPAGFAGIPIGLILTTIILAGCLAIWWRGVSRAARALALFDRWADDLGMIRCWPASRPLGGMRGLLLRRLARLCKPHTDAKEDSPAAVSGVVKHEGGNAR